MKDYPLKVPWSPKSESFQTHLALAFDIIITLWGYGKFSLVATCVLFDLSPLKFFVLLGQARLPGGSPSAKLTCPLHSVLILFDNLSHDFKKKSAWFQPDDK